MQPAPPRRSALPSAAPGFLLPTRRMMGCGHALFGVSLTALLNHLSEWESKRRLCTLCCSLHARPVGTNGGCWLAVPAYRGAQTSEPSARRWPSRCICRKDMADGCDTVFAMVIADHGRQMHQYGRPGRANMAAGRGQFAAIAQPCFPRAGFQSAATTAVEDGAVDVTPPGTLRTPRETGLVAGTRAAHGHKHGAWAWGDGESPSAL